MARRRRAIPFVVAAPSGAGKTTVCRAAVAQDPGLVFSVSHTTRERRPGERDGVDYHFVGCDEFRRLVEEGAFVEHAEYSGNLYGTSWAAVEAPLSQGLDVLLEIEVQGARQLRERLSGAVFLFLLPPSFEALATRLRARASDSGPEIEERLRIARRELREADRFDYLVVNDEIERAVGVLREIIEAERRGEPEPARARYGRDVLLPRLGRELGLERVLES